MAHPAVPFHPPAPASPEGDADAASRTSPRAPARRRWTGPAVVALLAAFFLHPALTPAHVEGFSASIVSLGRHLGHDGLAAYDPIFPANLEFFGLSRLGAALGVALFSLLPGVSAVLAMRLVMWLGLVLLGGASLSLLRRWTGGSPTLCALALLLLPGVAESAFFYNDGLLSAGLTLAGLALLASCRRLDAALGAGLLVGLGMVTRADAMLLGPAMLLVMLEEEGLTPRLVARGAALGIGTLLPVVVLLAVFHATFLDVLAISRYAVELWARALNPRQHLREVLEFTGIPALTFVAVGVAVLLGRREWRALALLLGVPLLFNAIYLGKLWEARQLLPLTPFIAALALRGWMWLQAHAGRRPVALLRTALATLAVGCVVLPPRRIMMDDGPRAPYTGRLQGLGVWAQWQRESNEDMARIQSLAQRIPAGRRVAILTDEWSSDRYLHLALQEAGYAVRPAGAPGSACAHAAERFTRGDREVLHVRLQVAFLPNFSALMAPRLERYARPCLAAAAAQDTLFLAEDEAMQLRFAPLPRAYVMAPRPDRDGAGGGIVSPHEAVVLHPPLLAAQQRFYTVWGRSFMRSAPPPSTRATTVDAADRLLARRVRFPDGERPGAPAGP